MSRSAETKRHAALGVGGVLFVLCCVAGPAVLGAVGGAVTGSVLLGAIVAALIVLAGYALARRFQHRSDGC